MCPSAPLPEIVRCPVEESKSKLILPGLEVDVGGVVVPVHAVVVIAGVVATGSSSGSLDIASVVHADVADVAVEGFPLVE